MNPNLKILGMSMCAAILACTAISGNAIAASSSSTAQTNVTNAASLSNAATNASSAPILKWLAKAGVKKEYLGDQGGLQGWLITLKGHEQTIYVTPDGRHAVAGILLGIGGHDLTATQMMGLVAIKKAMAKRPSPTTAINGMEAQATRLDKLPIAAFKAAVASTRSFVIGNPGAPEVVMIADPTCPVCHQAWKVLTPLVKNGKLRVRIALIDVLPGSRPLTEYMLRSGQEVKLWLSGVGSTSQGDKSVTLPKTESARAHRYLLENEHFGYKTGITSTPTFFWLQPHHVYRATGLKGLAAVLAALSNGKISKE